MGWKRTFSFRAPDDSKQVFFGRQRWLRIRLSSHSGVSVIIRRKLQLALLFAGVAFVCGTLSTLILWELFHGPLYIDMVIGAYGSWVLVTFPFIVAALAAFWVSFFDVHRFSMAQGALVALLTLVSFCILLNALYGGGVDRLLSLLLAALVFFGWALVIVGAATGWLVRRSINAHAKGALKTDTREDGARGSP